MSAVHSSGSIAEAYARARGSQASAPAWPTAYRAARTPWTLRRVGRLVAYTLGALAVGIALSISVPALFGMQSFAVLSGSMEPAIRTGDIVVVSKISPRDARVGDVVSFRSPDDPSKLLSHRVTEMQVTADSVRFVTKGDANTGVERWQVAASGKIGRVEYHVPKLGYVTNRLGSRLGQLAFLVVPALVLLLFELKRLWSPRDKGPTDAEQT